ncbi:helix-turn-helix transcriptional regulator (plasmid) [Roseomonas mucosa]|uniref:helix-turn-helix domain-containing protein n=1 Tax=Roseomonas mucosa TaxID=207340 RepID=UPI0030D5E86A
MAQGTNDLTAPPGSTELLGILGRRVAGAEEWVERAARTGAPKAEVTRAARSLAAERAVLARVEAFVIAHAAGVVPAPPPAGSRQATFVGLGPWTKAQDALEALPADAPPASVVAAIQALEDAHSWHLATWMTPVPAADPAPATQPIQAAPEPAAAEDVVAQDTRWPTWSADELKAWRVRMGWKQAQAAEELRTHRKAYAKLEQGGAPVRPAVRRLAELLERVAQVDQPPLAPASVPAPTEQIAPQLEAEEPSIVERAIEMPEGAGAELVPDLSSPVEAALWELLHAGEGGPSGTSAAEEQPAREAKPSVPRPRFLKPAGSV